MRNLQSQFIRTKVMGFSVTFAILFLPLAYPFVSGSTTLPTRYSDGQRPPPPLTTTTTTTTKTTSAIPTNYLTPQRFSALAAESIDKSLSFHQEKQEQDNNNNNNNDADTKSRVSSSPLRQRLGLGKNWTRRLFSRNSNNTGQEQKAPQPPAQQQQSLHLKSGLLSRLFFTYATPVAETAAKRQLQADDAFDFGQDQKMDTSVAHLTSIYKRLQAEAQAKSSLDISCRQSRADRHAWVLTKALLWHERRMLLYTAVLRFFNTVVQAFPALLVSRLLQLVEQGTAVPARKAITAALCLVAVLSLKMIIENQYFHHVVRSATHLRGSLSGLVFDKALRLPGGGTGVTHFSEDDGDDNANNNNNKSRGSNKSVTPFSSAAIGSGGVLNLMQSDTSIIENAAMQIHTTWDGLLQLAMYTFLLYRFLGPSVIYGCCILVTTIPINSLTLRILNRLTKYENQAKDARTKRTAESISNMKLLKLFGWEDSFSGDIAAHRREELKRSVSRGVVRALNTAISNAVPALVLVVTLQAYARSGQPIAASTIFTAISLFNQLRVPLFFYPMLVDSLANGRNAMRRVANFLAAPEIVPYVQYLPPLVLPCEQPSSVLLAGNTGKVNPTGGSIQMKHGNFMWSVSKGTSVGGNYDQKITSSVVKKDEMAAPALAGVELKVNPGEVVAVIGSVGQGKSALIKGLLGELQPVPAPLINEALSHQGNRTFLSHASIEQRPTVISHGAIAYCSQEAWLPKGTIRDAIVFGREYDEARYLSAVRDAGLDKDIVDDGDSATKADPKKGQLSHDTDVGEHGSALSGGQRARVALARALYSGDETKVFLLDDVLAALDATVGSIVFERLMARLRSINAAVVMVTNDPSLPRRCDRTILMGKVGSSTSCSTIIDSGSYDDLILRGHDLRSISAVEKEETANRAASSMASQVDVAKTELHLHRQQERSDFQVDPAKLMRMDKNTMLLSGGGSNGTWSGCHADPEDQFSMENCPDSMHRCETFPKSDKSEGMFFMRTPDLIHVYNDTTPVWSRSPLEDDNDKEYTYNVTPTAMTPRPKPSKKMASADDSMTTGAVPLKTYISYFKAARQPLLIAAMLISFLMVNGAQVFQQYTVARWSEVARGDAMAAAMGVKYMTSLVNAAGVVSVFLWLRSFITMLVGVKASTFFHSKMLSSVFRAPLSFFDATDSGQLLSRFGKEMETVDKGVPESIQWSLFCFLQIFSSIGALASVVTPGMAVPLGLVAVLYVRTMGLFRPAARDLKRAETKTRSPIYTHFGEALRGAETIRSVPGGKRFWSRTHRSLTDTNLNVFYSVKVMDRWLSTRLENLGNLVVLTAAMTSVYLARVGRLKAGSAGWGLTQALSVTGLLTWAVRCLTDLETNMMSVQRVMELTDIDAENADLDDMNKPRMPREPSQEGEGLVSLMRNSKFKGALAPLDSEALLNSGWPWRGNIRFKNVSMRYNPLAPLVLRDISLTVPAGTTLGVVGRTGSGKSSLLLTLFRLMEIESGGSIEIDGVDIRALSLKVLRQRALAIIPQDPTLFQGTVAYNLDATGKASESDMWAALTAASPSLAKQFHEDEGLNSMVAEGGKNLSQGQRQLICLARALLRRSKVLVLDEATSSVDSKTDQAVQETIRREFVDKGVTVITVAHRLDTVLGHDKIAVLGAGSVLEYGPPKQLLRNPNGELRRLVDADRKNKRKGSGAVVPLSVSSSPPVQVPAR